MADAHGSGPCVRKDVRVQLPPRPLDVLRFHARGERGRWDISSMLWGCNPHTPPGGASPPGTPLSVVTFRGPPWALLRRPAGGTFGGHCWALRRRPSVVTFGVGRCSGVASPAFGGHLGWPAVVACFVAGSSVSCFLWAPVCRACHLGVVVEGRIVSWFGLFGDGFATARGAGGARSPGAITSGVMDIGPARRQGAPGE
ncbi:MAG: hypothetical protein QOC74_4797 [Pseudonocardiales bacterium]|nr:hypothetical protein [Pseudonocardiales bacterium]